MPRVGFGLMTPVFQNAKTYHASDRAAIVIGPLVAAIKAKANCRFHAAAMFSSFILHKKKP
jgi:hypothetical protein